MVFSDTSPLVKYTSLLATQLCGGEVYFFDNFVRARDFLTGLAPQKVVVLIHVLYFLSVGRFGTLENSAWNDLPIPAVPGAKRTGNVANAFTVGQVSQYYGVYDARLSSLHGRLSSPDG